MNPLPGWYADPQNAANERWWDGQVWSQHVRSAAAAHGPPAPPVQASPFTANLAQNELNELAQRVAALRAEHEALKKHVVETSDAMILQEVGIYQYAHPLDSSAAYEGALAELTAAIKQSVKSGEAVTSTKKWVINGSEKEGAKMVTDFSKLILRAYNNEVDNVLRTLKPYALATAIERLEKLRATVAKLGVSMKLGVTDEYHALRVRELQMTADYLAKVSEEKEREREERIRLKEEESAKREFEREQEKLEKERAHYQAAAQTLLAKGDAAAAAEAQAHVVEVQQALDGVIQRAANIRAGYVYVISNIGSFGGTVVKIGLTRRLEPLERVRELGDASVPFRFDVHALIFSDDAVGLETALHQRFANQRLNLVSAHREFFFASPHQVKEALLQLKGDLVSFVEAPEALEWHQSQNTRRTALSLSGNPVPSPKAPQSVSPARV
jgi:hypothetical protein